ncbi:MAG TPA: hypothetical protein DFR83_08475 [Deltaproteobacteria bacterium]|nr:hypothetical protein [Deltaproteobacteria bacterium]
MGVTFNANASSVTPSATLTDGAGDAMSATFAFDETGFSAEITPEQTLDPSTAYELAIDVCGNSATTDFQTSDLGLPVRDGLESLDTNTYVFNIGDASFTEPAGLGAVLTSFMDTPLLLHVMDASSSTVDLALMQGRERSDGSFDVDSDVIVFSSRPLDVAFFELETDWSIEYGCATIPMYEMALQGTFSSDGERIGGGRLTTLLDTRDMGCLAGLGSDPDAICSLGDTFGVSCEDCPDGNPWCMSTHARLETFERVPTPEVLNFD